MSWIDDLRRIHRRALTCPDAAPDGFLPVGLTGVADDRMRHLIDHGYLLHRTGGVRLSPLAVSLVAPPR